MDFHKQLYINFLNQLKEEITLFKNEENIWSTEGSITNSPGNLCLHLCGNINHFLGATLGNTGYVRNREMEFAVKNVSREELMNNVDETIAVIEKVLGAMKKENLNDVYPLDKFGENATIDFILARLVSHLAYHVGQINYYRRIIEK